MTSELNAIYNGLIKALDNPSEFDSILVNFINSTPITPQTLATLAADPLFSSFVQCLFAPLTRYTVLRSSLSSIPGKIVTILEFLTSIITDNPEILRIVSANAPIDELVNKFLRESSFDKKKNNIALTSKSLPFLKFFTFIISEPNLIFKESDTIALLFKICDGLIQNPNLSEWALSIMACLLHNSTEALSYMKIQKYGKLQKTLVAYFSAASASHVLASLCVYIHLFPSQVQPQIVIKAAINSLVTSDSFTIAPKLTSWIIIELSENVKINAEDIWNIIESSMSGGLKAYHMYNLLSSLPKSYQTIIEVFQSMNCLFHVISTMLDSPYIFVSIAGINLLQMIFKPGVRLVFSDDIIEPFTKALKIATSSTKFAEIPRKEAALMLLKFLVRSRESMVYVLNILEQEQEAIFSDFLRQIEGSQSFITVQYFLFIFDVSHFISTWRYRLSNMVLNSQFPALLINILNSSRNYSSISDAVNAFYIITSEFKEERDLSKTPFFFSLVEGYVLTNRLEFEQQKDHLSEMETLTQELHNQVLQLEVEKDLCNKEFDQLKNAAEQCSLKLKSEMAQHVNVEQKNKELKDQLHQAQQQIKVLEEQIESGQEANKILTEKYSRLSRINGNTSIKEAGIRTKVSSIQEKQKEISKTEEDIKQLEDSFLQMKTDIDKFEQQKAQYIQNLKKSKSVLKERMKELNKIKSRITEMEISNNNLQGVIRKNKQKTRKLREVMREIEETEMNNSHQVMDIRAQIERAKAEKEEFILKTGLKEKAIQEMREHVSDLDIKNQEYKMLIRLLHKSTYPNKKIPSRLSSMLNLTATNQ